MQISRRDLLKSAAAIGIGAVGSQIVVPGGRALGSIPSDRAAAASMTAAKPATSVSSGDASIATVSSVQRNGLKVCTSDGTEYLAQPQDFPLGWEFRSGDKVTLRRSTLIALPLLLSIVGRCERQETRSAAVVVGGKTLLLQPATLQATSGWDGRGEYSTEIYHAHYEENAVDGSLMCFALLPQRLLAS